ncbi:MAG: CCA tRNA nucleotidyltransferase, partial [Acaryochloridaceae cyanobacterium SU_2_1]|nr:CCA tRNA nucleotidyltransferase [Acaryochloridaceae cyanobacterium SU_2_1]
LLDFFGGVVDLQDRQVRVLHPNSFIEDPTRIFRAVRFATRLGFDLGAQTETYIRNAIASGIYTQIPGKSNKVPALQTRLRNELKYILQGPHWSQALALLTDLGALHCLHPQLTLQAREWRQIRLAMRWQHLFDPTQSQIQSWLLILEALLASLPNPERRQVALNLHLPDLSQQRLQALDALRVSLETLPRDTPASQVSEILGRSVQPLLILVAAQSRLQQRRWIWQYLHHWSRVKPLLGGQDLIALGYPPGPTFKTILSALGAATLDGELHSPEQAQIWLQKYFPLDTAVSRHNTLNSEFEDPHRH